MLGDRVMVAKVCIQALSDYSFDRFLSRAVSLHFFAFCSCVEMVVFRGGQIDLIASSTFEC